MDCFDERIGQTITTCGIHTLSTANANLCHLCQMYMLVLLILTLKSDSFARLVDLRPSPILVGLNAKLARYLKVPTWYLRYLLRTLI